MHAEEILCLGGPLCGRRRGRVAPLNTRVINLFNLFNLALPSTLVGIAALLIGSTLAGCGADLSSVVKSEGGANAKVTPAISDPPSTQEFESGRLLVRFRQERAHDVPKLLAAMNAHISGEIPGIGVKIVELSPNASEAAQLSAFRQRAEVDFAELDWMFPPDAIPNDPIYGQAWHLTKIAAPSAWDVTTGTSDIIMAILDTGCDPTHPDLVNKYVAGWNFYDNNADTHDVTNHGTAVAGIVGAATNNALGVAAVAWNCPIMPIRISAVNGTASTSAMANGLVWAADHGARVANISYKVSTSSTVTSAAQYLQNHGGVVTISAGNDGTFTSTADNPYVLTVSATDSADALASWSSTGNNIDLAAPGVLITTTNNGGTYGSWSGTSFSAPIVAGVAALVISANPALSASDVQDILKQSADDLGTAGWDPQYGWGRVNASRAVNLALGSSGSSPPPPPPAPDTVSPSVQIASPAEGATVSGANVNVLVNVSDNVGVVRVDLYVDGLLKSSATAAPFTTKWNIKKTAAGAHTLECRAYDAAANNAWSGLRTVYK